MREALPKQRINTFFVYLVSGALKKQKYSKTLSEHFVCVLS